MTKYAVFILTHGRPHNVLTHGTLRKMGYTGDIYIIVDNEDATIDEYRAIYGDKVIVFDKLAISKTFDTGDNFEDRRAVIYARNACFDIAREMGVEYFLQLDDDYYWFGYHFTSGLTYEPRTIRNLDALFNLIWEFYKSIPALTIAMAQGGDFMGGARSAAGQALRLKRKAMNTFFCSTSRPFQFIGRINEDVNTYTTLGNRGGLFFTFFNAKMDQSDTQKASGGMTELYEDSGTYIKSFYTVMYQPSFVKIYEMGTHRKRLHHRIDWPCAVPKILSESYRKS